MITMRESVSTTKRSLQRRMGTFKRFGADKNRSSKTLKSDLIEYNLISRGKEPETALPPTTTTSACEALTPRRGASTTIPY